MFFLWFLVHCHETSVQRVIKIWLWWWWICKPNKISPPSLLLPHWPGAAWSTNTNLLPAIEWAGDCRWTLQSPGLCCGWGELTVGPILSSLADSFSIPCLDVLSLSLPTVKILILSPPLEGDSSHIYAYVQKFHVQKSYVCLHTVPLKHILPPEKWIMGSVCYWVVGTCDSVKGKLQCPEFIEGNNIPYFKCALKVYCVHSPELPLHVFMCLPLPLQIPAEEGSPEISESGGNSRQSPCSWESVPPPKYPIMISSKEKTPPKHM